MTKRFGLCLVGIWLMVANGVSQAPGEVPPAAADNVEMLFANPMGMNPDQIMTHADTVLRQGDTNMALNLIMMSHEVSLNQHANRFVSLLNTMLALGNLSEAERLYQENAAQQDRLTRDYYNIMHQYLAAKGDKQALLDWTASLQARAMPADFRVQAFGWLLDASRALGPASRVADLVPVCITNFDMATSRGILTGVIDVYENTGDYSAVTCVLDAIERAAGKQPEWRMLVTCQRVNLLFSSAQWSKAESRFQKEAPGLPDGELAGCFQRACACTSRDNQLDLQDRLCVIVLKQKNKPNAWQLAARTWLETAKTRKATADIPVRLEALMKMGCANKMLVSFLCEYWEPVVKDGKTADLAAMLKFSERLSAVVTDDQDKGSVLIIVAEGYFMQEDYQRALSIVEKPLSIFKPVEQAVIVDKIKAHLALQQGNKQEAIERFRTFMESVKTWTNPEVDPMTGQSFTREMCLGLNAKRIGDIQSSMNDVKAAQASYREAVDYYTRAQKDFKPGSPESETIKARLAELAKLLPKE